MPPDDQPEAQLRYLMTIVHAALNNRIAVSTGERLDDAVHVHINEVL